MDDRQLYPQKTEARLREWRAEVDKLKAKASGASADVQLDINRQIRLLEHDIEEAKAKLSEMAAAGEDALHGHGTRHPVDRYHAVAFLGLGFHMLDRVSKIACETLGDSLLSMPQSHREVHSCWPVETVEIPPMFRHEVEHAINVEIIRCERDHPERVAEHSELRNRLDARAHLGSGFQDP